MGADRKPAVLVMIIGTVIMIAQYIPCGIQTEQCPQAGSPQESSPCGTGIKGGADSRDTGSQYTLTIDDWPMFRQNPQGTSVGGNITLPLDVVWKYRPMDNNETWRFPVAVNGTVYIPKGSWVYAIDACTGTEIWSCNLSSPIQGQLLTGMGCLLGLQKTHLGITRWCLE